MNLLVTGGAGFIGANFVHYWINRYHNDKIVAIDKITYAGNLDRLVSLQHNPNFSFVQGDILDYNLVCELMDECDVVVHFAAETHVDRSLSGLEAEKIFNSTNIDGTITLLHAARETGIQRFHHISTDEVFGDLDFDNSRKFHEHFPYNPHNPYSISKAAADFAVRGFARSHGLPVTISNCTNNYGPYQLPEKIIPRSIALLLNGKKVQLYTDSAGNPGKNIRDWLHVEDHCRAIEKIIFNGKIGQTYCIGGNSEYSNHELVDRILSLMSQVTGTPYTFENSVEFVEDRPGHDRRYAMDTTKIEQELQWYPSYTFENGLQSTVEWYLSSKGQAWLEKLADATDEVRTGQDKKKV